MLDVDAQDVFEVAAADDQEPVETFGSDGSDKPLGVRVRLRRSHRRVDDPDSFAQSISRLLHDTKLWQRLVQDGRAHIALLNGREVARNQLLEIVARVLAKKSRQGSLECGWQSNGPKLNCSSSPIQRFGGGTSKRKSDGTWKISIGLLSMMSELAGYVGFRSWWRQRNNGSVIAKAR